MKRVLLLALLVFTSCDEFLEDCIFFPAQALILTDDLSDGQINVAYYQVIEGGVKNSSDDGFSYDYEIDGLPEGIRYYSERRNLILEGTPTEAGTFNVEVSLTIDDECYDQLFDEYENDCDNICGDTNTETKQYVLIINN